jgi:hypothetical protein
MPQARLAGMLAIPDFPVVAPQEARVHAIWHSLDTISIFGGLLTNRTTPPNFGLISEYTYWLAAGAPWGRPQGENLGESKWPSKC